MAPWVYVFVTLKLLYSFRHKIHTTNAKKIKLEHMLLESIFYNILNLLLV